MKTYKFDVTNEASLPVDKNVIDKAVVDEKTADKEEQIEKKPKKKLPIFGIGAIAFSVVALGVSLFAFICASLPTMLEFGYYFIYHFAGYFLMEIFDLFDISAGWLYDIFEVIFYRGEYYDYYYGVSHFEVLIMIINHWRDILLLIVSAIGTLLSGASLLVNIKGKSHLATGVGATALSISLVAVVSLVASIINYFEYDAMFILKFLVDAIELMF